MTFVGMKEGVSGPLVGYLQSVLAKTGFNPGKTDCVFGRRTKDAVMRFQQKAEIFADGQIDRETFFFFCRIFGGGLNIRPKKTKIFRRLRQNFLRRRHCLTPQIPKKQKNSQFLFFIIRCRSMCLTAMKFLNSTCKT